MARGGRREAPAQARRESGLRVRQVRCAELNRYLATPCRPEVRELQLPSPQNPVCGGPRWYTLRRSWRKLGSSRLTDEFSEVRDGLIMLRLRFHIQDAHLSVREELMCSLVAYSHIRENFRHALRFPLTTILFRCLASFRG